jgi:hypothetical protein
VQGFFSFFAFCSALAHKFGVAAVPKMFINGRVLIGAQPVAKFVAPARLRLSRARRAHHIEDDSRCHLIGVRGTAIVATRLGKSCIDRRSGTCQRS